MTSDVVDAVRSLAPALDPTTKSERARQRRKLTDAIEAETESLERVSHLGQEVGDVAAAGAGGSRRRRRYLVAAAAAAVAAAAVVVPLSIGNATNGRTSRDAAAVMVLDAVRLRLPHRYRLATAASSQCSALGVSFVSPGSSVSPGTTGSASPQNVPPYASRIAAAANAEGGCIAMALAPPYTPTASDPDPEAGRFESNPPVQVGQYEGRAGTWETYSKHSGVGRVQAGLYVEIPVAGRQLQDLAVSANDLTVRELISLVANGLSVAGGSGDS